MFKHETDFIAQTGDCNNGKISTQTKELGGLASQGPQSRGAFGCNISQLFLFPPKFVVPRKCFT